MAMAHVAAATPHLSYACDTHYPWSQAKDEVVVGGRVRAVAVGVVVATLGLGLGDVVAAEPASALCRAGTWRRSYQSVREQRTAKHQPGPTRGASCPATC